MDDLSLKLLDRLTEKALENASQEQRLAFVEKLFSEMLPAAQQEFLLKLAHLFTSGDSEKSQLEMALVGEDCGPRVVRMVRVDPGDASPWQTCCQIMDEFVCSPEPAQSDAAAVAKMFSGLADETRLQIVKLLAKSEATVEELVAQLDAAQSTVSHHLRVLREANLIRGERRGRNIYYALVHPLEKDVFAKEQPNNC
jgi:ArsR family transcriptional regulator, lead/cadmium/zinc/bismuth-responsive transcriptional repressor